MTIREWSFNVMGRTVHSVKALLASEGESILNLCLGCANTVNRGSASPLRLSVLEAIPADDQGGLSRELDPVSLDLQCVCLPRLLDQGFRG